MAYGESSSSKKRFAIIGISSTLLIALVVAATVSVGLKTTTHDNGSRTSVKSHEISASMKAIISICQPTNYKQECVNSLLSASGNTTDPKKLIQVGFQVAMKQISVAAKNSTLLQQLEKDPRATKALDTCKELLGLAVTELKQAFDRLGSDFDITEIDTMIMDLKVWISATVTYQETCLDAFENSTSDAGEKMKMILKSSMHLSSNSLAMVSTISSFLSGVDHKGLSRQLLVDDGLPVLGHEDFELPDDFNNLNDLNNTWYWPGFRKLLAAASRADVYKVNKAANIIVATDGSGKYKTINEALHHVPKHSNMTFVIYIKEGVYNELVHITKAMTNLMLIGDGANKTRITGNLNFVDGTPTYKTATVAVHGAHFMAKDIGFDNSAGPDKHQAVAIRVSADEAIFYRCAFDGYQDTLYTHVQRQFYRDCTISGTIDFVFGDAAAVFQNCTFVVRKPMPNQSCIVTAQGRKERRQPTGIIIINSRFTSDAAYYPLRHENKAYLGRPWKEYSRTIIMESYIDDFIRPQGWLPWEADFGLKTCFYAEYNNRGPGASKAKRVTWHGIKNITPQHALDFTPGRFFKGDRWVRLSGVPYFPGLTA
ncbi:probable pectinesterase/pectinesterase inhibitor 21 [Rosa rugosa]|uniref:probable pectinesterase/pectinesterase inhibitor 21 n=1 Tax=Rosa rugosa TaxID=74645 RepID=UPI002B4024F9|nr:probable pectinesterase/pectinesterase inhibitor 21 [Rosa rugosa]